MKNEILTLRSDLLSSPDKINWMVKRIISIRNAGKGAVVVLGVPEIMGDKIKGSRCDEEYLSIGSQAALCRSSASFLAEILKSRGCHSVVLDESSSGLSVDGNIPGSRIRGLDPENLKRVLSDGGVPVVSGSFGLDVEGRILFLGSAGAETFAVGIAALLDDPLCVIFQEKVQNMNSGDPGFHCHIKNGEGLSYQECMEAEVSGGHILSTRVIELAEKKGIPLMLAPFYSEQEGVLVMKKNLNESFAVSAVVSDTQTAKIAILGVPDVPGIAAKIFSGLAEARIGAEMIIQSVMRGQINDIAFLVRKEDIESAIEKCRVISREIGAQGVTFDTEIARVSLIGSGIANHPDIPSKMFAILADKGVNLEMIVASSISITCVVDSSREKEAVDSLKEHFID